MHDAARPCVRPQDIQALVDTVTASGVGGLLAQPVSYSEDNLDRVIACFWPFLQDKDGNLAVVAVMYREGTANALLTKLWSAIPAKEGEKAALPAGLDVGPLLPANRDYFRFNGSLTTPPCSEGVWWLVMKAQATVSKAQVEQFSKALGFANNRPIQPVNARPVLQ